MNTLKEEYIERCGTQSDINLHMPTLARLASECAHVAEFGVRTGNSTIAILFGLSQTSGGKLLSYDIMPQYVTPPDCAGVSWEFIQADTRRLTIPPVDMLFIDSLHTADQVGIELANAHCVSRYIAFHDTVLFGWRDEMNGMPGGILQAIFEFLASTEGHKWRVKLHDFRNNGLLVLERCYVANTATQTK